MANPKWWNEEHESTWSRVKAAMKRDWEQTKADFSKTKGRELDQDVDDTVKQAAGKQPIPPLSQPNRDDDDWDRVEEGYRYGVGARSQYGTQYNDWDDGLEGKLREEWRDMKSGRTWDEVKAAVRRGWDRVRK
jgi:hypothetical protein